MKIPANTETFNFHNENPKGKKTTDCVVRAIAFITQKGWAEVTKELCGFAIKYSQDAADPLLYHKYLESLGFMKCKQPRQYNADDGFQTKKYTGAEFCRSGMLAAKQGCVAHLGGNHLTAIKDNKIHDIWNGSHKCIGNYWIKIKGDK